MPETAALTLPLRVASLAARKPTRFDLVPGPADLALLAEELGLAGLRKLRFRGALRPAGRNDWLLEADLGATVVQSCIATLAPVTTRIEERVTRRYVAGLEPPTAEEVEMPEDDSEEPLPEVIDPGAVMVEALTLSLPLYPRAGEPDETAAAVAPPGVEPLGDSARRPFAGLADLLARKAATDDGTA